jgi:hypothetical protein
MDQDLNQQIQERAYAIWEREGRSGDPEDHWLRAEQELKGVASRDGDDPEAKPSGDKIIDKLGDFA